MGFSDWIAHNWFSLLQSLGIIGGLFFTGISLRIDAKVRRLGNLLTITQQHREIWTNLYRRPELSRVLDPKANVTSEPVTEEEEMFILLLLVHLGTTRDVLKTGMLDKPDEGVPKDIKWFFSLPVPKTVWERVKDRQDEAFVRFVESCRK
jgi:hypothetical protein